MLLISPLKNFLRNVIRRGRVEQDLDAEVRAYLAMLIEEKINAGMAAEEARRAAQLELGGVEQVKERVREVRFGVWMELLAREVRFALRTLANHPGFTALAILTLALGIGANTAIFSLVDAVMLKSLPVANPQQLTASVTLTIAAR
jgi:hypothetical protein